MVSIYLYIIILIANVNSIISILVKGNSPLYSKVSLLSTNLDLSRDENINVKDSLLKNVEKIRPNSSMILSFLSSKRYDAGNALNDVLHRVSTNYKSYLNDDLKPIYEDESSSDTGYHYNPPISGNIQIFKEEPKEIKNTDTSQKILNAIATLDRYLKPYFNNDSYNSPLLLPTNPILSLILSRYGRYIPGHGNSGIYSYMAVNNINNNKPFGKYKYERDEDYTNN